MSLFRPLIFQMIHNGLKPILTEFIVHTEEIVEILILLQNYFYPNPMSDAYRAKVLSSVQETTS